MYNEFDFGKTEIFFRSGLDKAETQVVADLPVGQNHWTRGVREYTGSQLAPLLSALSMTGTLTHRRHFDGHNQDPTKTQLRHGA
jgi:hypothetical protein